MVATVKCLSYIRKNGPNELLVVKLLFSKSPSQGAKGPVWKIPAWSQTGSQKEGCVTLDDLEFGGLERKSENLLMKKGGISLDPVAFLVFRQKNLFFTS